MKRKRKKWRKKLWHDNRARKIASKPRRDKKYTPYFYYGRSNSNTEFYEASPVVAPKDICLTEETKDCLTFFNELRREKNISRIGKLRFVQMDLSHIEFFDYSSICVLIAIINDLKVKRIYLRGNYPIDSKCKEKIIESGLLTFMYDDSGNPFEKSVKSDLLFVENGSKRLSKEDNKRISETVRNVVLHLTGEPKHCPKLRRILMEICGNSLEWGGTSNKQWLLGVMYEDNKAIFTITDVGKGILNTLNVKFKLKLKDLFTLKSDSEKLLGAFYKKYGSNTREINRNKGLPSIRRGFENGIINNLLVLTNNVVLHFEDNIRSEIMQKPYFNGTLYRWEVNKETILKSIRNGDIC